MASKSAWIDGSTTFHVDRPGENLHGLHDVGPGVDQHVVGVGLAGGGELGLPAAGDVLLDHRRRVAAERRDQVERLAVGGEVEQVEGQGILRAGLEPGTERGRRLVADADDHAAIGRARLGGADLQAVDRPPSR